MKILLTGSTGFLGYRTLEKLTTCDWASEIIATGRNIREYRYIDHKKISYMLGDLGDGAFVNKLCKGVDVVINTASLSSPWGAREAFVRANVITQENLIQAAQENSVSRFVYISSPSIYYNGENRELVKESDPLPSQFVNNYAHTKYMAEQLLVESGLQYVIIRPRALIGRGDDVIMPRLIKAYDAGKLKVIGDGHNVVDLTSVSNVADAILLSVVAENSAMNQAYNITNGEPVLLWEKIRTVLSMLDKELEERKLPFILVHSVAQLMEWKSSLMNEGEPVLTKYGVGTLAKSFTLDIEKAKSLLNYVPKMGTDEAILEFVNWYKSHDSM